MKDGTKTVLVIIIAFLLLGLGIYGIIKSFNKGVSSFMNTIFEEGELKLHTEIDTTGINNISINVSSTNIEIKEYEGTAIKFDYYSNDNYVPTIDVVSDSIVIFEDESYEINCVGFCINKQKLVINVPKNYLPKYEIITVSGDIYGTSNIDNIDIATVSGDIELKKISGETNISTTSGDVFINEFDGTSNSFIRTTSGDVEIYNCNIYVEADTTSGDIDIYTNIPTNNILKINTTSGDIKVN